VAVASVGADRDGPETGETRLALEQVEPRRLLDALLAAGAEVGDDLPFPLADSAHVDGNLAGADPVIGRPANQIGHPGARHHRLGRGTALVDAGSGDVRLLDQCGPPPGVRQRLR